MSNPARYDLKIYKNTTFRNIFYYTDINKNPINLTGYTAEFRASSGGVTVLRKQNLSIDPLQGAITVLLSEGDYGKQFARDDFYLMAEVLKQLQGKFIMSVNARPELHDLFNWAQIDVVETTYTIAGGDKSESVKEFVISNV
jgi:hypothetical protein